MSRTPESLVRLGTPPGSSQLALLRKRCSEALSYCKHSAWCSDCKLALPGHQQGPDGKWGACESSELVAVVLSW